MTSKYVAYCYDPLPHIVEQIDTLQILAVFNSEKEAQNYIDNINKHPKIEYFWQKTFNQ